MLLTVPALLNVLLALAIALTTDALPLALAITALGLVWIAVPAMEMLPFEFEGILPREVAAVSALVAMFAGLGFAAGPMIVGVSSGVERFAASGACGYVVVLGSRRIRGV